MGGGEIEKGGFEEQRLNPLQSHSNFNLFDERLKRE
jgi:hypothetical protein